MTDHRYIKLLLTETEMAEILSAIYQVLDDTPDPHRLNTLLDLRAELHRQIDQQLAENTP